MNTSTSTGLKELVSEVKEAKGHALKSALDWPDDETVEKLLLYAESLAAAEAHLQIALVRKIRMERSEA